MKLRKTFINLLIMCILSTSLCYISCKDDSDSEPEKTEVTSNTVTNPDGSTTTTTTYSDGSTQTVTNNPDGSTTTVTTDPSTGTTTTTTTDSNGNTQTTTEQTSTTTEPKETTIWTGSTDLNDWGINIQIPASNFADVSEGSQIIITYSNSTTATDYRKLQLYYMASDWLQLTGGSYNNGSYDYDKKGIDITESPLTYTITADNAAKLKQYGLAIIGHGVVITQVVLKTGGTSTNNGSNNNNSGNNTTITPDPEPTSVTGTPYANHGKLSVKGAYLYDSKGAKYQLYGMSTHGLNFGDDMTRYVNKAAFTDLCDKWNTNAIRLVVYPKQYGGYSDGGDKNALKQIIYNGVEYATSLGMYVIIDWHVHEYNPTETQADAIEFLTTMAAKYANYGNVLYEICNEPTGSEWSSVLKPYAETVTSEIRKYAKDAVVIVGTNTWSQDVEGPAADPLASSYGNVMYTFHFYASTHKDDMRTRVKNAIDKGCPIFITEFGTCTADGQSNVDETETNKWFDFIKTYNLSHFNWSLCNKNEAASAIQSSCSKTSGWEESDLTTSGKIIYNHFRTLTR